MREEAELYLWSVHGLSTMIECLWNRSLDWQFKKEKEFSRVTIKDNFLDFLRKNCKSGGIASQWTQFIVHLLSLYNGKL